MAERRPSLKERLGRLEAELDELIRLQDIRKAQSVEHVTVSSAAQHRKNCHFQQCQAVNVTTRSKTMLSNNRPCCSHDPGTSAPLNDISKFLQHINLNLSKGTQAIAKLATTTSQETAERGRNKKQCNSSNYAKGEGDVPNVWRSPVEKKTNEDSVYKDLREEKDKRMRAESRIKCLKEELKKTTSELQQKAESTISLLQQELKDTSEKLKCAEYEIQKLYEEGKTAEYMWPLKYGIVDKELQEEKEKRKEAEEKTRRLQDTLQKVFHDTEEHLTLQKTANRLKNQNDNLLCLTTKLRGELETKNSDICRKTRCIEDNFSKIKELTCLCGKLRDILIITREKFATTEDKLKLTMEHCQRQSESILQSHRRVEDLQNIREENNKENKRLSELLLCSQKKNNSLQSRLEEMSEMMKKQNELITRQSDTLDNKEEQLRLALENIKLQAQRLADVENKTAGSHKGADTKHKCLLQAEISRLLIELEHEKENIMIKDKIIDSHLNTISEKKTEIAKKESEINRVKRDLSESERRLSIEKTTNEELLSKIKQLQLQKQELKQRNEDLEEEFIQSSKQTSKLDEIERQIHLKQREWEDMKLRLVKEKDEALNALRIEKEKLAERTANDQTELDKKQTIVDFLNRQVQDKNDQIEEAKGEIERLTKQVQESDERIDKIKKHFEGALQATCESWKKTMNQLAG